MGLVRLGCWKQLSHISNAIQVLEEELKAQSQDAAHSDGTTADDAARVEPSQVNGSLDRVAT